MRRLIALALVVALMIGVAAPAAHAGSTATNVALGLASFAVFSQLVGPLLFPPVAQAAAPVVVERPVPVPVLQPAYYPPPEPAQPAYYPRRVPPPPPPVRTVVHYRTGMYVLRGDGIHRPYHWVWIPYRHGWDDPRGPLY